MSVRTDLAAAIRAEVPKTRIDVKDEPVLTDVIRKATAYVTHQGYAHPQNLRGFMDATFVVTIASHHEDRTKAEDALDQDVLTLLNAIHTAGATWTTVQRVFVADTYVGFNISCSIPTTTSY